MAENKYSKPIEDDEESEGAARYRLPFALCKRNGIAVQDWWTPRDAWDALRRNGAVDDVDEEYAKMRREAKKKADKKRREEKEKEKEKEKRKAQATDPEHSPDYDLEHTPGEIAGVKQGKAMDFAAANGGKVNPYFSASASGELYGYTTNCQTCVVAFEARRRGFDVRALPNNRNGYIRDLSHDTASAWIDPSTGEKPRISYAPKGAQKEKWLEGAVREGGRYTLRYTHQSSYIGHIVCIERTAEGVQLYDPQTGGIIKGATAIAKSLSGKRDLGLLRVDNLAFNPEVADHIMRGAK